MSSKVVKKSSSSSPSKVYVGTIQRYLSHTDKSIDLPKSNSNSYNWFTYAWKMRCLETGEKFSGKKVLDMWRSLPDEKKEIFKKSALKKREPKKKAHGKIKVGAYQKFERMLSDSGISCPISGLNFNSYASIVWKKIGDDHPKVQKDWLKKDLSTQKKYVREAVRKIEWNVGSKKPSEDSDSDSDSGSSYYSDSYYSDSYSDDESSKKEIDDGPDSFG